MNSRSLSLLLLLLMWCPAPSSAQTRPRAEARAEQKKRIKPSRAIIAEARRRFIRANNSYRLGNYKEALLNYQAALDLYEEPVILYNLAQTYEKLRDPARAALFFERYLQIRPRAGDRAAVLARVARLKKHAKVDVDITSYPPGAAIYIGTRQKGVRGRTPFTLPLPLGPQKVILDLHGFNPEERDIDVGLGKSNFVDVQLRRRSSIKVTSDVPGAKVNIVGKTVQFRTPKVFEVPPGRYPILVELRGYHPVSEEIDLRAGEQLSLMVNLKPLPKYGHLQVEGVRGAAVVIEGKAIAHLPMKPHKIPAGTHLVTVSCDGYRTWESKITVATDRLTVARVNLTSLRGTAVNTVMYGSVGLAAASLIAGSVFGVLALGTERDYWLVSSPSKYDKGTGQALAADILFGAAAAFAITAVVTYFVTQRGPSDADLIFAELPAPPPAPASQPTPNIPPASQPASPGSPASQPAPAGVAEESKTP